MPLCPLCRRDVPALSSHHLHPRSRGGRAEQTVEICFDSHDAIHELFDNRELADRLSTLDALRSEPRFAAHVRWLSRQSPNRRFPTRRSKARKRRR